MRSAIAAVATAWKHGRRTSGMWQGRCGNNRRVVVVARSCCCSFSSSSSRLLQQQQQIQPQEQEQRVHEQHEHEEEFYSSKRTRRTSPQPPAESWKNPKYNGRTTATTATTRNYISWTRNEDKENPEDCLTPTHSHMHTDTNTNTNTMPNGWLSLSSSYWNPTRTFQVPYLSNNSSSSSSITTHRHYYTSVAVASTATATATAATEDDDDDAAAASMDDHYDKNMNDSMKEQQVAFEDSKRKRLSTPTSSTFRPRLMALRRELYGLGGADQQQQQQQQQQDATTLLSVPPSQPPQPQRISMESIRTFQPPERKLKRQQQQSQPWNVKTSPVVTTETTTKTTNKKTVHGSVTPAATTTTTTTTARVPITVESDEQQEEQRRLLFEWADSLPDPPSAEEALMDQHHRQHTYLRLSLTEKCNLRCTYCMPEHGVPLQPKEHLLQTNELLVLARHFRKAGVTKFRLTGGEPTLRHDLVDIVAGLAELQPRMIGMTTNGVTLYQKLPALLQAGLTHVNISLDTVNPQAFEALTRRPATYLDKVWKSIDMAHSLMCTNNNDDTSSHSDNPYTFFHKNNTRVKLNCVVMRGKNDHEIASFLQLARDKYPGIAVRFIEYMPFSENGWNTQQFVPYTEMIDNVHNHSNLRLVPVPSPDPHDTTKWYRTVQQEPGDTFTTAAAAQEEALQGPQVGFITSMSQHFCAACNRLRLTADGQIKVCLFDGTSQVSLRDAVRAGMSPQQLTRIIYHAVQQKKKSLGGHENAVHISQDAANNRPMTLIGG